MKSCPTCNRTFENTMTFCLEDGSVLSAPSQSNTMPNALVLEDPESVPTLLLDVDTDHGPTPIVNVNQPVTPPPVTIRLPEAMSRPGPTVAAHYDSSTSENVQAVVPDSPLKTIVAPLPNVMLGVIGPGDLAEQPTNRVVPSGQRRLAIIGGVVFALLFVTAIGWFLFQIKTRKSSTGGTSAQAATVNNTKLAPSGNTFVENANGVDIQMVSITGGTFLMGSASSEAGRDPDEGPQANVAVKNFYLSKFEVTQAQYKAVTGLSPSSFKGDDLPVDGVSWKEAVEFCRKLSSLRGRQYRLPTEAEWEYAARAGSKEPVAGSLAIMGWCGANSLNRTHPVGQKDANAFGLYDMYGNVWEWCQSQYKSYPYQATDGREDLRQTDVHVLRGGSWESSTTACRSSYRRRVVPDPRTTGFRIALSGS